ncbi:uncharacterized protein LOC107490625 [Arachis duranensis]|uniref:Uncharacterized protein LOC107490625 n=1 Tax=Arachis duranensis TaxID=130453 RepID=A0A6P4DML3_ARADU|nr:uncharacterized protein LOC107490625 [Arachis duranensis]
MLVSLGCLLNLTGRSQRLLKGSMLIEFSTLCYSPHHIDIDFEMNSIPRSCGDVRSLRRQLMEEQEQALELIEMQRRRVAVCPKFSVYFTPFLLLHKWNENFRRSFQFQLSSSRIFQKHTQKEI